MTIHATAFGREVVYPESDGEPVGETDFHIGVILYLRSALRWLFREHPDVYVAADMLLYHEEGDPTARIAPDVFVVRGVSKHDRRTYKLWEERVPPCLIVEVTSRSSRIEDLATKRGLYEMLGVAEYLVFDPLGEYLRPRFRAYELVGKEYRSVELPPDGPFQSRALPVTFQPEGALLRAIDSLTGTPVPGLEESAERAVQALRVAERESLRAESEAHRAEALEAALGRYRERFGALEED